MDRRPLQSGLLRSAGYDRGSRALEIEFADGRVVQYYNVDSAVYRNRIEAATPEAFFHEVIEGSFPSAPVKEAYR
ncbi:KTSC domain-containing protein [Methanoculleus sp. FWC-SCC1]|uniref:KTSC domain-containing protein n=1 Tax=Methanoculleus frigidifontis TaxID=2584085 RepID=A0ABT8MAA3_9EURY|nr:KTSC domain-containing protein [Methanoculleus sp. FWC-SCC1]MDN7024861.1 KTSC domain-containing protein [Methanoculleus sp. FWC-SCC1]